MFFINRKIKIPDDELHYSFSRSSGPGGQNVNKVNTKVTLRWPVAESSISEQVKKRFLRLYATRINERGELRLSSQRFRKRQQNLEACQERLRQMILAVMLPPKKRVPTKPTRASGERRLKNKKMRRQRKEYRSRPRVEE